MTEQTSELVFTFKEFPGMEFTQSDLLEYQEKGVKFTFDRVLNTLKFLECPIYYEIYPGSVALMGQLIGMKQDAVVPIKSPPKDSPYELRQTKWIVLPKGEPVFCEGATEVEIIDEAGGEFVVVTQVHTNYSENKLRIDPKEWPLIREAIDLAFNNIK